MQEVHTSVAHTYQCDVITIAAVKNATISSTRCSTSGVDAAASREGRPGGGARPAHHQSTAPTVVLAKHHGELRGAEVATSHMVCVLPARSLVPLFSLLALGLASAPLDLALTLAAGAGRPLVVFRANSRLFIGVNARHLLPSAVCTLLSVYI
jgi:hypothetical protein